MDPLASPPLTVAAPVTVPDQRPAADAAALSRVPVPDVPLPLPPTLSQQATVSRVSLGEDGGLTRADRVLKPFGVPMLPSAEADRPAADSPTPERSEKVSED